MQVRAKGSQYKRPQSRQKNVSHMIFSAKLRRKSASQHNSINSLKIVNKYIFVQDFETAETLLKKLSSAYPNDYEILFRRVEVSSKRNTLLELLHDLKKLSKEFPNSKAVEFAILLGSIRISAKNDMEKDKKHPFKTYSEYHYQHSDLQIPQKVPLINILSNRKIRINRTLDIPDDYFPEQDLENGAKFDIENKDTNPSKNQLREDYYHKAIQFKLTFPENYAAWYVAGCALESIGRVTEAIEHWKQAFHLNADSICVLATLTELQQMGAIADHSNNFAERFEALDKYLVYGHFETHTGLYHEFMKLNDHKNAINALKSLADWLQKQYGEVPVEIEILCLLGAMQAYKIANNIPASEACRAEVENIVIACKKSPRDMNQIYFIAQLCDEYGLKSLARICYFAVLISKESPPELVMQTASLSVSTSPSEGLMECLKVAYKNLNGSPEIRFCILLCGLKISEIDVNNYMLLKNKIREAIAKEHPKEIILKQLNEINEIYQFDPEIHYYLGEIHSRIGNNQEAKKYFQYMFNADFYNSDGILRYIFFLLKIRDYNSAREIAQESLNNSSLTEQQSNEMHWSIAATFYSEGEFLNAFDEIHKSLSHDPWNHSYLILLLRASINLNENEFLSQSENIVKNLEEFILQNDNALNIQREQLLEKLTKFGFDCLQNNYSEFAWNLAKCAILISEKLSDNLLQFIAKAGASFNSRTSVQELLVLKHKSSKDFNFGILSACIAQIYSLTGNWPLVDEWLLIAKNNQGSSTKITKHKLFELEALSIIMKGTDFKRAQTLVEAAIDSYDNIQKVPHDTKVLHGYILVTQGQYSAGIEKMQNNISTNASIQSLYFLIKGLERAGQLNSATQESLSQIFHIFPTNTFEQKMIEEIFITVGSKNNTSPVGLAC